MMGSEGTDSIRARRSGNDGLNCNCNPGGIFYEILGHGVLVRLGPILERKGWIFLCLDSYVAGSVGCYEVRRLWCTK